MYIYTYIYNIWTRTNCNLRTLWIFKYQQHATAHECYSVPQGTSCHKAIMVITRSTCS